MDSVLHALADPNRQRLLRLAANGEQTAGELAAHFQVSRQAVSQHLQVLKGAGLISERRQGTRRYYRARPEATAPLREFLDSLWSNQLPRLKLAAESSRGPERSRRAARAN